MLALIYISIAATLIAIAFVIALRPLAKKLGLVDKPDGRKTHAGEVPLIGGPILWLIIAIGSIFSPAGFPWVFIILALGIVIIGGMDDRKPLSPTIRLVIQITLALLLVLNQENHLHDIGVFQSYYNVENLYPVHVGVAVFAILVSVNSFNFIDGIDGLSASMALLAVTHLNMTYNLIGLQQNATILFYSVILIGALSGFLLFNLQVFNGRKIFLGDSGAMFIGFAIAATLLAVSQSDYKNTGAIPAALCLWMIALPLTDMTTIIVRRLASRRSPLEPDRRHLHHILMQAGFSQRRTLLVMILSAIGAFWIGYAVFKYFGEAASIASFFIFMPVYYLTILRVDRVVAFLRD